MQAGLLKEIATALAAVEPEGTFATELGCSGEDLHIEVEGVGPIRFPISAATARKLCSVARPAPFGRRDKTLLDTSVRDSWEIGRRQLKIDTQRWRRTLAPKLALVRQRLGLPEGGELHAELDKMLVYGPGQFFAPHQDSERADDMVGTLVVELPSRHEGGSIVVEHDGKKKVFRRAARGPKDLSLLAFYADCRHEVRPVDAGYRISLTYHLLYRGAAEARAPLCRAAIEPIEAGIKAYLSTPISLPYAQSPPRRPDRLIYLLDHEYTRKSLGWGQLKNADRLRASALQEVAERLDCEVYLALADVHESWSCEGAWDDYGDRWRGDRGHDDDPEGARDADEHDLIDLLDTDVVLRHWVGPDGRSAPGIATMRAGDDVCFTRASTEMAPFKSEHEGYMGNYGNTVDRWYHRAAVVMWPRDLAFEVRAKLAPSWAVDELASHVEAGRADEARDKAKRLLSSWHPAASDELSEAFFKRLIEVSAALGDADLALGLVSPSGPHRLSPGVVPAFVALVERYGFSWSKQVFSAWAERARYNTPPWLSFLPRLGEALRAGGEHGEALAAWVLAREVASLVKGCKGALLLPEAVREASTDRLLDDLLSLLETAAAIRAPSIRDDLIASLTAPESALPLMTAGALLKRCREGRKPTAVQALGLQALVRRVEALLERAVAANARSADDWSIEPPPGCSCALCKVLAAFLVDRAQVQLAWPLAKERRRHIHGVIDAHGLPVTHTTLRRGSPQTLVLTKEKALFEREAALRAQQRALLTWLKKERGAFG
ncbi:2OG-Fe(II) oxygenase [Sorangium sp. So ce1504]|uniref:2OG-Fe(II) oxygenase n=1 Tax=Sorangium sp. So ce1504 TaxID=3133337 RepID=UPI003F636346